MTRGICRISGRRLSKGYLKGTGGPETLSFRPEKFYHDQKIEVIVDRGAAIDRAARKLKLASGSLARLRPSRARHRRAQPAA